MLPPARSIPCRRVPAQGTLLLRSIAVPGTEGITSVLVACRRGDRGAFDRLVSLVYPELRRIARAQLGRWRPGVSLDTIGVVHEAYLKLIDQTKVHWQDRNHFFAIAARHAAVIIDRFSSAPRATTPQDVVVYGRELLYSGPLFTHQLSHLWIDFRGIRDAFMRERGSDYFENSRQATFVQQEYAVRNPLGFEGYGEHCWGITASDGPGWVKRAVNGVDREFYGYIARGAPFGPDDGTVSPWVVVASLPFAQVGGSRPTTSASTRDRSC